MTENTREAKTYLVMSGDVFLTSDGGFTNNPLNAAKFSVRTQAERSSQPGEQVVVAHVTFVIEEL